MRTSKTVNGVTYNYYYNRTQLAVQEWTDANSVTRTLHFIYDESGAPYAVVYNNGTNEYVYYYITDLQGNVVSIVSRYMNVMAYYEYDAWGNVISTTNGSGTPVTGGTTIAYVNPILYRGYYYDRETSLYYLQTRYYDPAVGRFLNADGFTTTGGFLGYNMFAYCENNPINKVDPAGTDAVLLLNSKGMGHVGALIQDNEGNWYHIFWGAEDTFLNRIGAGLGFGVKSDKRITRYYGEPTIEDINNSAYGKGYTDMCYLTGDFSYSLTFFSYYSNDYYFYTNNCSQLVFNTLSQSDTKYRPYLEEESETLIPSSGFNSFKSNCYKNNLSVTKQSSYKPFKRSGGGGKMVMMTR